MMSQVAANDRAVSVHGTKNRIDVLDRIQRESPSKNEKARLDENESRVVEANRTVDLVPKVAVVSGYKRSQ